MASTLFCGSYLRCTSKKIVWAHHICTVTTGQLVTWSLRRNTASRFGKRCFCNLQMQMKTGALPGFCFGANSVALRAKCPTRYSKSIMFLEFSPPFLSSKIITNVFQRLSQWPRRIRWPSQRACTWVLLWPFLSKSKFLENNADLGPQLPFASWNPCVVHRAGGCLKSTVNLKALGHCGKSSCNSYFQFSLNFF